MFNHRIERAIGVVGGKVERGPGKPFALRLGTHRFGKGRFTDASLATDQHYLTVAFLALCPAAEEQAELLVATDQWEAVCRIALLHLVFGIGQSDHTPCVHRLGDAFQFKSAEILTSECRFDKYVRRRADDHRVRLGHALQARSNVRGFTSSRHLFRGSFTNAFANYDEACGDANPHTRLDLPVALRLEVGQRFNNAEAAQYSPLGVILMGPGIAEID